jgi:anti-sigma B factor antagonist
MRSYQLEVSHDGGREVRLTIHGDVDLAVAPALLDSLLCAALIYDHHLIVVDLSDVSFMDSSGLRALIDAGHQLAQQRSHLVVAHPSPVIARVIRQAGIDSYLDVRFGAIGAPRVAFDGSQRTDHPTLG